MRRLAAILLLVSTSAMPLPALTSGDVCSIEPCCSMDSPMDCCSIEEAPAEAPELVLTDGTRVAPPVPTDEVVVNGDEITIASGSETPEQVPYASPPQRRLALLSTYLI